MSTTSFADLGITSPICKALAARGITEPFAVQSLVVPDVLAGHDLLVKSPTGSGKTLAFIAPVIDRLKDDQQRPAALVLAPTRELAVQIVEEARPLAQSRGRAITAVYGGVGIDRQMRQARRSHILVATPGRLMDLLKRKAFTLEHISVLILDEADRMLDMGFRPIVDEIVAKTPAKRQTLFFSATLDGEVGRVAREYTRSAKRHEHAPPRRKVRVDHRFLNVTRSGKVDTLVQELENAERGLALVFVRTKRGADRLAKNLTGRDIKSAVMHGDKSQAQRQRALDRFESGRVDTLVATDVAARGIDIDGITHVINYDPPRDSDDYVHRIGRTARAGRSGVGITLVFDDECRDVIRIARKLDIEHGLSSQRPSSSRGSSNGRQKRRHQSGGGNGGGKRRSGMKQGRR